MNPIDPPTTIRSVACVRHEVRERVFIGCGRGWTQDESAPLVCPVCGRKTLITGLFRSVDLRSGQAMVALGTTPV